MEVLFYCHFYTIEITTLLQFPELYFQIFHTVANSEKLPTFYYAIFYKFTLKISPNFINDFISVVVVFI